jgi:hypothetical protein
VARIHHARQTQQDEGELKRAPGGALALYVTPVFTLCVRLQGGDVHCLIRQRECLADDRITLEEGNASLNARPRLINLLDELISRLLQRVAIERAVALLVQPAYVLRRERFQGPGKALAVELGQIRHAQGQPRDGPVLHVGHLVGRQLRRHEGADHAVLIRLGRQDARVVPDRPLLTVAKEQRENARVAVARRVLAAPVGPRQETALEMQGEAHLEDEGAISLLLQRGPLVDDPEAEHARAIAQALHRSRAQLADDAQPHRLRNTNAFLGQLLLVEADREADGAVRDALPPDPLLVGSP